MNRLRVTYFALVALLSTASCTKEAVEPDVYDWTKGEIYFRTSLMDVADTRAMDMTLDKLESFQVTCFTMEDSEHDATEGILPYFEDATFIRQLSPVGTTYVSSPEEGPYDWPDTKGELKFFTFSPSRNVMIAGNTALDDKDKSAYFNLINNSKETNSSPFIGYQLGTVRVNPDISGQFDFITASTSGERWKDFTAGIELEFSHRMCRVELKAWGDNSDCEFEIAGIRLGNPTVEGIFNFTSDSEMEEFWEIPDNAVKDKVEYIFQGNNAKTSVEPITRDSEEENIGGDRIYCINSTTHNTPELAESIMGNGGPAMVLPTINAKWEGLDDANIATVPYSTDKMYFSVLLRVLSTHNHNTIYPYPDRSGNMTVIYFAVHNSGKIISRLYPGDEPNTFFKDKEKQQPYTPAEDEEIKGFGWAAIPVDVDWEAGKNYVYTLNYSEGVGLHDPEDPEPGKPIKGLEATISWGIHVEKWEVAKEDDDYTPDIVVPKLN